MFYSTALDYYGQKILIIYCFKIFIIDWCAAVRWSLGTLPTYIFHKHTHKQCPSLSHSFTVSHKDYFFLSHTLSFVTFVSLLLLRFLCLVVLQLQSSHFILNKSFSFEAYHRDSATEKEMEVNRCLYEIDRYRNENNLARRLSRIEQYLTDWLSMKPDRKSTVWNQCDQMLK